ncbi:MAG: aconitase family protein, partial [candidate division KSB1 bacterium]|nr:aconitase family protein [candidate division KSB1 bacterium]
MPGQTVIEKILSRASSQKVQAGERCWATIDLAVVRDFGGPNVVLEFEKFTEGKGKVWDPDKIAFTFDYQAPAKTEKVAQNQVLCREFARRQGIKNVFDVHTGIGQHYLLERGMIEPGSVVVGTDSHMNLLGAVGSFATGMGTTDITAAWYAGKLWFRVPETLKVTFIGKYEPPTSAKDVILKFLKEVGPDRANYKSLEFYGPAIDSMSLAERLTLGSMITEANGKIMFITPSGQTLEFLEQRISKKVSPVIPDDDAVYEEEIEID